VRQELTLKVSFNQLKWNWTPYKSSEIIIHMNNVKKPIKLHKKNSLDKYSENIIYLLISYKICYYIDLN